MVSTAFVTVVLAATAAVAGVVTKPPTSRFRFYDIPTPAALPCDLVTGPDGAEWVQYLLSEKIARIDPDTGNITEYNIPFTSSLLSNKNLPTLGGRALLACVIRNGNDGNIYAANGMRNQLVKLDMNTKKVSVFDVPGILQPLGNLQPLNDLWGAEEGMYFSQTTANLISLFDYTTHRIKSWKVPTPLSAPLGMRTASDGNLWFTELVGQKIARLNHTSGDIEEYPLPLTELTSPAVMRVETNARYLWFTAAGSNSIGRIDIYTGAFRAYKNDAPLSTGSTPSENTMDGAGNIWFSTWTQNLLHKLDPRTGRFEHVQIPQTAVTAPVSVPFGFGFGIDYNDRTKKIWFTQVALNRVGAYEL